MIKISESQSRNSISETGENWVQDNDYHGKLVQIEDMEENKQGKIADKVKIQIESLGSQEIEVNDSIGSLSPSFILHDVKYRTQNNSPIQIQKNQAKSSKRVSIMTIEENDGGRVN